jgi:hypothetical protein
VSEKFKESVRKSGAKVQKTQKDEKKAKRSDFLLASFLVKIIINKKYDDLLPFLFKAMDDSFPSNFLLGILSLISSDISDKIRELSLKEKLTFDYQTNEVKEFDDNHLDETVKNRINYWVEDIIDITSIEYSSILTEKLIKNIQNNANISLLTSKIFKFFLKEINITITDGKSQNISSFILNEIEKSIRKLDIEDI